MKAGETELIVQLGDITKQEVDVIVNAANSGLRGGGGVDGAIHRAGGPTILRECIEIRSGCPTGEAVITGAGELHAKYVIHAVGPVWRGGEKGEAELLSEAYKSSLKLALEHGCKSIAFPSLSTGIYNYPMNFASKIAIQTVSSFCEKNEGIEKVVFVVFSDESLALYEEAMT